MADQRGINTIFYPCIPYERKEFPDASNNYNCPIVTSYAENIKNNVDDITSGNVKLYNPFMSFADEETLTKRLEEVMKEDFDIPASEVKAAVHAAQCEGVEDQGAVAGYYKILGLHNYICK